MNHLNISNIEDAGRAATVWGDELFDTPSRFGSVAMALLPASLILATATALMLAMF